jgi:hypothetical protein
VAVSTFIRAPRDVTRSTASLPFPITRFAGIHHGPVAQWQILADAFLRVGIAVVIQALVEVAVQIVEILDPEQHARLQQ